MFTFFIVCFAPERFKSVALSVQTIRKWSKKTSIELFYTQSTNLSATLTKTNLVLKKLGNYSQVWEYLRSKKKPPLWSMVVVVSCCSSEVFNFILILQFLIKKK